MWTRKNFKRPREHSLVILTALLVLAAGGLSSRASGGEASLEAEVRAADSLAARFEFDRAIAGFSAAAEKLEHSSDRALYVRCLNLLADAYGRADKYREEDSLASLAETIALRDLGPDHPELGTTFGLLGVLRAYEDKPEESIAYFRRSLENRIKNRGEEDPYVGACYAQLGNAYRLSGDIRHALACLDSAKVLQTKAYGRDHIDVATTIAMQADVFHARGEDRRTIDSLQVSLHILARIGKLVSPDAEWCYALLARSCARLGRFDEVEKWEKKVLEIRRQLYSPRSAGVGFALAGLGDEHLWMGDIEAARREYEEAWSILQAAYDDKNSSVLAIELKLAELYAEQGNFGPAVALGRASVEGQAGAYGPMNFHMERCYQTLGDIYHKAGSTDSSLAAYRKAAAVSVSKDGTKYSFEYARILERLGEAFSAVGLLDSASVFFRQSLLIQDSCGVLGPTLRCRTYAAMGDLEKRRGNTAAALAAYRQALRAVVPDADDSTADPPPPGGGNDKDYVKVLTRKAQLLESACERTGDRSYLERALSAYSKCALALDQLMKQYRSEGSKLFLQENSSPVYEGGLELSRRLCSLSGERRYLESWFLFAEKSKAAVLQEGILESKTKHFAGVPDSLIEKEEELHRTMTALSTRAQVEEERHDAASREDLRRRLIDVGEDLHQLQRQMQTRYPGYARLRATQQPVRLQEVQKALGPKECFVEYSLARTSLHVIVIEPDSVSALAFPLRQNLDSLTREMLRSVKSMDKQGYLASADKLSRLLISPIAASLRRSDKLVIAADGILHYLPFEILWVPGRMKTTERREFSSLPYLVRTHEVSYAFSATLFAESRQRVRPEEHQQVTFAGFAPVFGDSTSAYKKPVQVFASNDVLSDARSITLDGKTFSALPYSEREVQSIVAGFRRQGERSVGYLRADATKENFVANAGSYSVLHIATHGYVNESRPDISALLFYPSADSASSEDAVLYAGETYNLRLKADLVVLSSCESGIGRLVRGEGLMAMTRGFFYAGAKNLVFSLWKVSDRHADELMRAFYGNILRGRTYAAALRMAKLELLRNEATAFPLKWAGFVLLGE